MEEKKKSKKGFASMDPERRREICRKGGKAAHVAGTAHQFTPEEARIAGRKGGAKLAENKAYMKELGQKGGKARAANYEKRRLQQQKAEVPVTSELRNE